MADFNGKILVIGCGAVARSSIPLIVERFNIPHDHVFILDPREKTDCMKRFSCEDVHFTQTALTKENYVELLGQRLQAGDICIDLANGVDTHDVLLWCQQNNVRYLNTCLNYWPAPTEISLQSLYQKALELGAKHVSKATAVLSHGANPGLISSFVKQALMDSAQYVLALKPKNDAAIKAALDNLQFNELAYHLGVKTIHIAEHDSQVVTPTMVGRRVISTWSIPEFMHESLSHTEFAWGSHEKEIPSHAKVVDGVISFDNRALDNRTQSWVPNTSFQGMIPAHDEALSIADFLSIKDAKINYRPTVLFVYHPSIAAQESLQELLMGHPKEPGIIVTNEIVGGTEKMGALLIGDSFNWWTGSLLTIEESNRLIPDSNATIVQVAAGVLAAMTFLIENPEKGICLPEQLDHQEVLTIAKPYLGEFVSMHVEKDVLQLLY